MYALCVVLGASNLIGRKADGSLYPFGHHLLFTSDAIQRASLRIIKDNVAEGRATPWGVIEPVSIGQISGHKHPGLSLGKIALVEARGGGSTA